MLKQTLWKSLGKGEANRISIVSSLILALMVVFYLFNVGSFFELDIYYLEERTTIHDAFSNKYIISKQVDELILFCAFGLLLILSVKQRNMKLGLGCVFVVLLGIGLVYSFNIITAVSLLSIPIIGLIFVLQKYFLKDKVSIETSLLLLNYLCVGIIVLALLSITLSLISLRLDQAITVRDYFIESFILLSRFSPLFMFMLIFSAPLRYIMSEVFSKVVRRDNISILNYRRITPASISRSHRILAIGVCITFSVLITLVPHLGQENRLIGVDTVYYVSWIQELRQSQNIDDFLNQINFEINSGDRPLSMIFLFFITLPSSNDGLGMYIEYLVPSILAPLLTIAIYYLTREISRNEVAAILSAFLTAVSFQVVIGIYAGFYANWISLIFGYFSLVYLFRSLENPRKMNLILFGGLLVMVMFAHVYTYTVFVLFISIFLLVLLALKRYKRQRVLILFVIVGSTVILDIFRTLDNPSMTGLESDLSVAERTGSGLSQFSYRWDNLVRAVQVFLGGAYSNILIIGLALYAAVALYSKSNYALFVAVFLSLGILPLFFGERDLMSRVLYDIPFQIPVAFTLLWIVQSSRAMFFIVPCIFVSLTAVAIYMLSNFPF